MMTKMQRLEVFQQTRQAVLNGELEEQAAVTALTETGWSTSAARLAVSVWRSLELLRPYQMTDLERMARLLRLPTFGEPAGLPEECPGFGRELPADWQCPPCPRADACYAALMRSKEVVEEKK